MRIRNRIFDFKEKKYIMGILNVTPDSFSDGGRYQSVEQSLLHVKKMISEGADIIDIGGESTRPGHTPVSTKEELRRIIPVIQAIREFSDVVISVDTFKAETMKEAFLAGADICNDVWGLSKDPKMADLIRSFEAPVIIMHNKHNNHYDHFMEEIIDELKAQIEIALRAGINEDKIIIDPGVGFALSYELDLTVLNRLDQFVKLGYPVLLGTSRKRFIGRATHMEQADQRIVGTCITTAIGAERGASIFRVHDVKENLAALRMTTAILGEGE